MKTWHLNTVTFALVLGSAAAVEADSIVKENKTWSKTYAVASDAPQLEISNIWGDVRVRPGSSDEIVVSVKEVRSAPNQKLFERSQEIIRLNIDATSDGVSMRVGNPDQRWNQTDQCRSCRVNYQFEILVPANAVIDVSTVNDGEIDVSGVTGGVSASNVNGPVTIGGMANCEDISTVNGPINVTYSKAPTTDCKFNTVNGDVNLTMPSNANLNVSVDLFNGEVSSELPIEPFALPAKVERVTKDGRQKYLIKKKSGFSIGANGPVYSIASMNGDVRIKRNQ